MPIDRQSVEWIASLARIKVDKDTLDQLSCELSSILDLVEQLGEVDTTKARPDVVTLRLRKYSKARFSDKSEDHPGRADIACEQIPARDGILRNAPRVIGGFLAVPKVVE